MLNMPEPGVASMTLRPTLSFVFGIVGAVIAAAIAGELTFTSLGLEDLSGVVAATMFVMTIFVIYREKQN
jgi:hypothetical protein